MNRGSKSKAHIHLNGKIASMRPRFMNRGSRDSPIRSRPIQSRFNEAPIHESGKFLHIIKWILQSAASMRPRFMNRGSTTAAASASVPIRLQ